ncbi:hypothetical protein GGQ99_004727 [Aminobacter niigataensis]|uniref:Uncharacterized protein n=1 Tax=Aminobacter niigataensis TaxID=83265 RepID=A0ABR6L813_9HYPH|nr:hypothetical protein [Aminobacter niigataensis]MBB4652943.1 hypothetical protein [Aminobacter niigataensis]
MISALSGCLSLDAVRRQRGLMQGIRSDIAPRPDYAVVDLTCMPGSQHETQERDRKLTYYQSLKVSGSAIASAVAIAILHDLKANKISLDGLPQILVERCETTGFQVSLKWDESVVRFFIADVEAKAAVALLKRSGDHDPAMFNRVQASVAALEAKVSQAR